MTTQIMDSQRDFEKPVGRQPYFSPIRWTAIFAGLAGGLASYMLLSLLGVAVGLTAVDPQSSDPVGSVPVATGVWTGISMLAGAFIGGYVSGHMSGLFRKADGMLHGFVAWGSTTLLFAVLMASALGAVLGGTFQILGQGLTTGAQVAATASPNQNLTERLASIITGSAEATVTPESLANVREHLAASDRDAAVSVMVNEMGFTQAGANQVADRLMPLFGPQGEQQVRDVANKATNTLSAASWWLFAGLLLSMGLGMLGGVMGARARSNRQTGAEHLSERNARPVVKQPFFGDETRTVPVVNRNDETLKRR